MSAAACDAGGPVPICDAGAILEPYDSDHMIHAFGFGAAWGALDGRRGLRLFNVQPAGGHTSHAFPLTFDDRRTEVSVVP